MRLVCLNGASLVDDFAFQVLFVVYIIFTLILLINVLIAMMGHTFTKIAETRWEWQRQWAKIVLVNFN